MLVYPYFNPNRDNSEFRLPPLGLGYIASYLKKSGFSVAIVDCTFMKQSKAVESVRRLKPSIIGIYSMFSMFKQSVELAKALRPECELLVAGGPLPTLNPKSFLDYFDLVIKGEGEQTFLEVAKSFSENKGYSSIRGLYHRNCGEITYNGDREFFENLDAIPFPARELFPNEEYIRYWHRKHMLAKTSIITTRGCPFNCDFCSNAIFGVSYRERTADNVVDEIEEALKLGYESIFFVDDCFTLNKVRVLKICDEILERGLDFEWECLSRVDGISVGLAKKMKQAGCRRIFFGIESGNDGILKIIGKGFTIEQARKTVENVVSAGIDAGAFFIVGYPGEADQTILDTIDFSTSLPLEYLSYTLPYPIPGTGLYEKVKDKLTSEDWVRSKYGFTDHSLIYKSQFSNTKLKFAIAKGLAEFKIKKKLGKSSWIIYKPFKKITDYIFKHLV